MFVVMDYLNVDIFDHPVPIAVFSSEELARQYAIDCQMAYQQDLCARRGDSLYAELDLNDMLFEVVQVSHWVI
jgi:hypothetical protein